VVVEGGEEGLVVALLEVRVSGSRQLPTHPVLQLHPVEPQHHVVRTHVPLQHLGTALEQLGLLQGQRPRVAVEARLEGVGEEPLDEGVVALQSFVIAVPFGEHLVDEFSVGPGWRFVEVEFSVDVGLLLRLRL
jgi:hypothetical protein